MTARAAGHPPSESPTTATAHHPSELPAFHPEHPEGCVPGRVRRRSLLTAVATLISSASGEHRRRVDLWFQDVLSPALSRGAFLRPAAGPPRDRPPAPPVATSPRRWRRRLHAVRLPPLPGRRPDLGAAVRNGTDLRLRRSRRGAASCLHARVRLCDACGTARTRGRRPLRHPSPIGFLAVGYDTGDEAVPLLRSGRRRTAAVLRARRRVGRCRGPLKSALHHCAPSRIAGVLPC
jgi:hypothetical protein